MVCFGNILYNIFNLILGGAGLLGFNWLDVTIICILVFGLIDGMKKGFIVSFFNIAGIFISLYASKILMGFVSNFIIKNTSIYAELKDSFVKRVAGLDKISLNLLKLFNVKGATLTDSVTLIVINIACFIFIFIISTIIINIFKNILKQQVKKSALKYVDRILGGSIGFIVAAILIFIFFAVVVPFTTVMSKNGTLALAIDHSKFAKYFYYFNFVIPWLQQANNSKDIFNFINEIRKNH